MENLNKAGLLLRLMGWISLAGSIGLIAMATIFVFSGGSGYAADSFSLMLILFLAILTLAISILHLKVGSAIKQGKNWGKVTGVVLAITSLLGFPIGTIFGAATLFYLKKGWGERLDAT